MSAQVGSDNLPLRKRGRPAGKQRIPLSLEQRRARNAQYERERRNETAEAMAELAEAAGCDPNISNADLLINVIEKIQKAAEDKMTDDIENLKHINDKLMSQIEILENRLNDCIEQEPKPRACSEIQPTSGIYKERTNKPKRKKIKLSTDDGMNLNVASKLKTMTKSQIKPLRDKQESLYTIKKSTIKINADRENALDRTKFQPGPNVKIEPQSLKSSRTTDHFTHKELNPTTHTAQTSFASTIPAKLPNNKIPNEMQTELTEEVPQENNKTVSILNLLTDNETGLFGDTECTYNTIGARDIEVNETDWTLDNLIASYL